jgi:uncharacterized membrane protein
MTTTTVQTRSADGIALAFAGYFLLAISVFAAGIPALAALILAYWQRPRATPGLAAHFTRQIVIFWIAVLMIVVALALGVAALAVAAGHLVQFTAHGGWTMISVDAGRLADFDFDHGQFNIATPVAGLALGSFAAWCLSGLWLFLAPIVGAIGLARSPLIGNRGL